MTRASAYRDALKASWKDIMREVSEVMAESSPGEPPGGGLRSKEADNVGSQQAGRLRKGEDAILEDTNVGRFQVDSGGRSFCSLGLHPLC
uniref:Uncharacterized protein n=1 Tax=Physcomitrium patens TaxID=3218 RepID=A0A2K1JM23_PHYPA|nr:hypothetical protein PHYPA_017255 [Physcomitrium patens]